MILACIVGLFIKKVFAISGIEHVEFPYYRHGYLQILTLSYYQKINVAIP